MNQFKRKVISASILLTISINAHAVVFDAFGNPVPTQYFSPSAQTPTLIIVDQPYTNGSSQLNGINSAIFGTGSTVYGDYSTGIGNGISFGSPSNVIANTTVVGNSASTTGTGDNNTVVGANSTTSGRNNTILGASGNATGNNSVSIGFGSNTTLNNDVSVGGRNISQVLTATTGDQAVNLNQATGLANQAQNNSFAYTDAKTQNSVSYDSSTKSSVTLNKGGTAVQVKNVAYATQLTDGANLQNVYDVSRSYYNQTQINISESINKSVTQSNLYTDNRITQVNTRIDRLDKRINSVGAMSAASASLQPNPHVQNNNQVAMAVGTFNGATAVAGALYHYSPSKNIQYNVHISVASGGNSIGAGIAFGF